MTDVSEGATAGRTGTGAAPIIHWFRQDLRLEDNRALIAAAETGRPVIPLFIWEPDTAAATRAVGRARRWWLHQSLMALNMRLRDVGSRLILRRGDATQVLLSVAAETGAETVHMTRRYEPDEQHRETALNAALASHSITCRRFAGTLLTNPDNVRTKTGVPYKVFTPFYKTLLAAGEPAQPRPAPTHVPAPKSWPESDELVTWSLQPTSPDWAGGLRDAWTPGEVGAVARLRSFLDTAAHDYDDARNRPDLPGTSRLSPYLHHGEISPQTAWSMARLHEVQTDGRDSGGVNSFLREIVWREFSYHLLHNFPSLPVEPFRADFAAFPWRDDRAALTAWQTGQTGYPMVDAGMRELYATGWMHNRVRMIAASFLVKHLLIHWREGEAWFWDTLVDADRASNAAGWQWVAGSGADAAPYFRIFNPISQGAKFDPNGDYVRKWVPEIARLPNKFLFSPWQAPGLTLREAGIKLGETYPNPIVDHPTARQRALDAYDVVKQAKANAA